MEIEEAFRIRGGIPYGGWVINNWRTRRTVSL